MSGRVDDDATTVADLGTVDGFHRRLGVPERPALLMVDLCRAYFTEGSPLHLGRPEVVEAAGALVELARMHGIPVVWTRVVFGPGGDDTVFERKVGALEVFRDGHPLGDWLPELVPADDELVISKQAASAFTGTDLAERLGSAGHDGVLVAGVSTSGCVRATATDACMLGFVPVVVADACGDRAEITHTSNLADLDAKYADVETLDHVRRVLHDRASTSGA